MASSVGEIFNISVVVNDLDPGWEAVGFEFKLSYDPTILARAFEYLYNEVKKREQKLQQSKA
jgi:hypothetical protein